MYWSDGSAWTHARIPWCDSGARGDYRDYRDYRDYPSGPTPQRHVGAPTVITSAEPVR